MSRTVMVRNGPEVSLEYSMALLGTQTAARPQISYHPLTAGTALSGEDNPAQVKGLPEVTQVASFLG